MNLCFLLFFYNLNNVKLMLPSIYQYFKYGCNFLIYFILFNIFKLIVLSINLRFYSPTSLFKEWNSSIQAHINDFLQTLVLCRSNDSIANLVRHALPPPTHTTTTKLKLIWVFFIYFVCLCKCFIYIINFFLMKLSIKNSTNVCILETFQCTILYKLVK